MDTTAIILAAGKGVRMMSDLPKVSHMLCGKPMIVRVLEAIGKISFNKTFVVVGYKADIVRDECRDFRVVFVEQKEQLGTGHAVMQVRPFMKTDSIVLVLNGDVPLIKPSTLSRLIGLHKSKNASATMLTASVDDPFGYGRVVRAGDGHILRIVEQKDASPEELAITEINTGTYCFNSEELFSALGKVKPNNTQKEFYLTDVIAILGKENKPVHAFRVEDPIEVLGVNTKEELQRLEGICGNVT